MLSRTSDLEAAENDVYLSQTGEARLTVLTASYKRKHGACRAEIEGYVSAYTYITRAM